MTLVERVALIKNQKERDLKEAERKKVPSPPHVNIATSHAHAHSNTSSSSNTNINSNSNINSNTSSSTSSANIAHANTQYQKKIGSKLTIGLLPHSQHPTTSGHPSGSNSARESREPDVECEKLRAERPRGRFKSAGSFHNFPGAGVGAGVGGGAGMGIGIGMGMGARSDDSPMISLSPSVQQLLHPPPHIETVPFSVPIRKDQTSFSPKSR